MGLEPVASYDIIRFLQQLFCVSFVVTAFATGGRVSDKIVADGQEATEQ